MINVHNIRYMHSGEVIYNKAIQSAQKRISAIKLVIIQTTPPIPLGRIVLRAIIHNLHTHNIAEREVNISSSFIQPHIKSYRYIYNIRRIRLQYILLAYCTKALLYIIIAIYPIIASSVCHWQSTFMSSSSLYSATAVYILDQMMLYISSCLGVYIDLYIITSRYRPLYSAGGG